MKNTMKQILGFTFTTLIALTSALMAAAPANDNFANAMTLDFPTYNVEVDNTQATGEASEPNHAGTSGALHSVWYKWTPADNYSVTIDVVGGLDSTLAVYTGSSMNNLTLVRANDNVGNGQHKYSRVTFAAVSGTTYRIAVSGANGAVGTTFLNIDINTAESSKFTDYDGNTRGDFTLFRPSNGLWYINEELYSNDNKVYTQFGLNGDIPMTGDYSGDGYGSDVCVWRPTTGVFYYYNVLNDTAKVVQYGQVGDIPVSGDFDGDDIADLAIWRPSTGTFWVKRSTTGTDMVQKWGVGATDVPVPADYDGDGKTDFAIRRNSGVEAGTFYVLRSSDNSYTPVKFGLGSDLTVPGDYDFDGKNDIAVYRQSDNTYYVIGSQTQNLLTMKWGMAGDMPVPGDYTGNPRSAYAVWRPSTGTLYVLDRYDVMYTGKWGAQGDIPVAWTRVR